jgi:DNA-binding beta-propeller fold protein YncE
MKRTLATVIATLIAPSIGAQSPAPTYWQDIRPIFRKHCTVCHSAKNLAELDVSGGLALDTFAAAIKGSRQPVLRPGESGNSLLVKLITSDNAKRRMPLDAPPLPKETIDLIRRWIDTGAKEGQQPDAAPESLTSVKSAATRKLDLLFPTAAAPPAGWFGKTPPGKLELALKIGPLSPVAAVAFSPNGKLLASGSYGQVAIWDLNAGKLAKVLHNVLGAVNDLRFSPDGKILAVAGGQPSAKGDLRLYQVSDWKLLGVLRGHDDVVFSVSFSPDGNQFASASFDHTLGLWDVAQLKLLKTYKSHSDFVYAVAFAPSGKHLFSASKDRSVQMTDLATGKTTFTFSGMDQDVMAVAVSPDGKNVVSSGFEAGIYWWNPQTGERVKVQNGHSVAVHELAFSKDGKKLVSAGADRTVRVWDGGTGAVQRTINVGSVAYAVAISPNNKLIAAGSFDGLTLLFDEATGRQLATLVAVHGEGDQTEWLALTPEGWTIGSDKLVSLARFRMGGQEVNAAPVWLKLRRPDAVAKALRGDAVEAVKFEKK